MYSLVVYWLTTLGGVDGEDVGLVVVGVVVETSGLALVSVISLDIGVSSTSTIEVVGQGQLSQSLREHHQSVLVLETLADWLLRLVLLVVYRRSSPPVDTKRQVSKNALITVERDL